MKKLFFLIIINLTSLNASFLKKSYEKSVQYLRSLSRPFDGLFSRSTNKNNLFADSSPLQETNSQKAKFSVKPLTEERTAYERRMHNFADPKVLSFQMPPLNSNPETIKALIEHQSANQPIKK